MRTALVLTALIGAVAAAPAEAQQKKLPPNTVVYDLTVQADGAAHTGTMQLTVAAGKVTGDMHITHPGEITGKPAGTSKAGVMKLDFPYRMVQRSCDGRIAMDLKMPAKAGAGPTTGTAAITGCDGAKLAGTVEMMPKKK